jgi:hypothetical protein
MQIHFYNVSREKFLQQHWIVKPQKKNVFVHEFNERLLRVVQGAETFTIDKTHHTVNRLEFVFSFVRNVLACEQVDL